MVQENTTLHAIVDYTFANDISFNSIVAYHDNQTQIIHESTHDKIAGQRPCQWFTPCGERLFGQELFLVERKGDDFSAEARFSSSQEGALRWTAGVNYVEGTTHGGNITGELVNVPPTFFANTGRIDTETLSAFGGVYYDVATDFTLSAEVRYQSDKVTSTPFDAAILALTDDPANILSGRFNSFAPR